MVHTKRGLNVPSAQDFLANMLRVRPTDALQVFYRLCVLENVWEPVTLVQSAQATMKAIRTNNPSVPGNEQMVELADRWYASLNNGSGPDFGVYDSPLYLAEAFACWAVYSRSYLLGLEKPQNLPPKGIAADLGYKGYPYSIVDLGCGIGFSTAGLAQLFPWATVTGTNVPDSPQTRIAERVADPYGRGQPRFRMVAEPSDLDGPTCLVFASEYFEHFQEPIAHLHEVIDALKPEALLIANTFTNPSIGHFDTYKVAGAELTGAQTSKAFNNELRANGYTKVPTKLWNNRPAYWKKVG